MFDFVKKKIIENRDNDDLLFEYVLEEMEDDVIVKSSWAKALAYSEGNENKAKSLYMQYRVQSIKDIFTKLRISYNDLEKAVLLEKIKSLFNKSEEQESHINVEVVEEDEDKEEEHIKTYTKLDVFFYTKCYTEEEKKDILGDEYE